MKNVDRVICCTLLTNITFLAERESDEYTSKLKSEVMSVDKSGYQIANLANITLTAVSNRGGDHSRIQGKPGGG